MKMRQIALTLSQVLHGGLVTHHHVAGDGVESGTSRLEPGLSAWPGILMNSRADDVIQRPL